MHWRFVINQLGLLSLLLSGAMMLTGIAGLLFEW